MAKRIPIMAGDTKCGSLLAIFCIPTQFVAAPLAIFCIPTHFVGDTLSGATPILDLSTLNTFLNTESFKMETPETIRTSLQSGEWVTSIDFKDAYFHIPIHSQSRKYMHFHIQGQSYQFKALPFGLSTAPMEFTVVAKEVKLMALQRGIRIHQYLDDWLVRATSHQTCLQHTQTLVALCRELGWLVNKEKSELEPKQARSDPHQIIGRPYKTRYCQSCPVRCARSGSSCPS